MAVKDNTTKIRLKKTWRWFGPNDAVKLNWLKQLEVEGVVTALHHFPAGEIWTEDEILKRKNEIENAGLGWEIVESLAVSEEIKQGTSLRDRHIENYKTSLKNLARHGIKTVVYNFMPVLDWIRTDLNYRLASGGESMLFDPVVFAAFDLFILKRPGAEKDYTEAIFQQAKKTFDLMPEAEKEKLAHNIIVVTQGFINGLAYDSSEDYKGQFLAHLDKYKNIGKKELRENLAYFLNEVIPVAEKVGINLAIHPDDPPFPVLGLPRIFSTIKDMQWLAETNPSLNNGIAFCAGSFSARKDNDLICMAKEFGDRIHFAHLRNTEILENGSFYESGHLKGWVDMADLVRVLLNEMQKRKSAGRGDFQIPMRPDHGIKLFEDFNLKANPGYPLFGRMKGLAEITGLEYSLFKK